MCVGREQNLRRWIGAHVPVNTKSTYAGYQRQFVEFCATERLPLDSPVAVAEFLRFGLEVKKWSRSTLNNVAASAIADMHRFERYHPTSDPLVKTTKKVITSCTEASKGKIPLPTRYLERMARSALPTEKEIRDVFLFILMFGGLLRESEAVALEFSDVWISKDELEGECLYVFIQKSKTDQQRRGDTVVLAACPGSCLCPVEWFRLHCGVRRSNTHVFHSTFSVPAQLSVKRPNGLLKEWLEKMEVPNVDVYGSHSLRKGGATAAAAARVQNHVLKRHGRWRSDAVYIYTVDPLNQRLEVSRAVLGA